LPVVRGTAFGNSAEWRAVEILRAMYARSSRSRGVNIRASLRDWLHERRIRRLYRAHVAATKNGASKFVRHRLFEQFQLAVAQRSPEAVLRLERKKGLTTQ
jgi:hypothetical protein